MTCSDVSDPALLARAILDKILLYVDLGVESFLLQRMFENDSRNSEAVGCIPVITINSYKKR